MGSEGGGVLRKAGKRKNAKGVFVKNSAGRGRNVYYAAPPGAYPGVRTGLLRRSINFGRTSDSRTPGLQMMRVGTRVAYGRYLDRGTSRMAARPWAMKSVGLSRDRMMKTFARVAAQQIGRQVRVGA
jgi:hypothetical protein